MFNTQLSVIPVHEAMGRPGYQGFCRVPTLALPRSRALSFWCGALPCPLPDVLAVGPGACPGSSPGWVMSVKSASSSLTSWELLSGLEPGWPSVPLLPFLGSWRHDRLPPQGWWCSLLPPPSHALSSSWGAILHRRWPYCIVTRHSSTAIVAVGVLLLLGGQLCGLHVRVVGLLSSVFWCCVVVAWLL